MTPLDEFENMWRSVGPVSDAMTREAYQARLVDGEHNVRRTIRRVAARRRFIYNAAVNPPDEATWAKARAHRVEEIKDELLEATARRIDNLPVPGFLSKAEAQELKERLLSQARRIDNFPGPGFLSKAEAQELKERLLFQEGAAFVLDFIRCRFPPGTSLDTKLEFMEVQAADLEASNLALFGLQ